MSKKILSKKKKKKTGHLQTAHFYLQFHMIVFVYLLSGTLVTHLKLLLSLSRVLLKHVNVPALKLVVLSLEASCFSVREEKSNSTPCQRNRLAGCSVARHLFSHPPRHDLKQMTFVRSWLFCSWLLYVYYGAFVWWESFRQNVYRQR